MATGYPDGQSYAQWRGDNLAANIVSPLPAGITNLGFQLITSWRGVHLRVVPSVGFGRVTLFWYGDTAETLLLGSDQWGVNPGTALNVKVAAKGPVCDMRINNTSGGNMTASVQLVPTNAITADFEYAVTNNWVNSGTITVPISGTSDIFLPFVQRGLASVSFLPSDATGNLTAVVARYTETPVFQDQLVNLGKPVAAVNQLVGLVDDICGIHVINGDAAATHTYAARLVAGLGQS
jgi:hypothetical protein